VSHAPNSTSKLAGPTPVLANVSPPTAPVPPRKPSIGVEVRGRWIKAAQPTGSGLRPGWRFARVERPFTPGPRAFAPTQADIDRLIIALAAGGFEGSQLVLAAPSAALLSQSLELPPRSSGAPIDALAVAELARSFRLEVGSLEAAVWDTPGGGRASISSVLVVGLEHAAATDFLAPFANAAFRPIAIDVASAALARLPQGPETGVDGHTGAAQAFVDLGWDDTVLTIVVNGLPIYQRRLDDGGLSTAYADIIARESVTQAAVDAVLLPASSGDPESEVIRAMLLARWRGSMSRIIEPVAIELDRSLTYASHRFPSTPTILVGLCGDGALLPGLSERLQAKLPCVHFGVVADPVFAVAKGLSMWSRALCQQTPSSREAA